MTDDTSWTKEKPTTEPEARTAQERLQRLKKIVEHLNHTWSDVLHRQLCMQALGRREDLHKALEHTYAANITNMLQHVLVMDLLREIGALILDSDRKSAGVLRAFSGLRDPELMKVLRAEHEVVRPATNFNTGSMPAHVLKQFEAGRVVRDRQEQIERFDGILTELTALEPKIRDSDVAARLRDIRNKGVAHYDVVRDGNSWKLWAEGGTEVTWDEINDFIDTCTKGIELLYGAVCHTSFNFEEAQKVYQGNVDEFVDALAAGLRSNKERQERERAEALAKRRAEHGL
jgi:AbiU2